MEDNTTKANSVVWVQSKSNDSPRRIWSAFLSLAAVALFMGALVAVCHHLFYHFLDGRRVDLIIPQAWAIIIATAMTFLCKTFLVLAVATAFVQVMFNHLRHKSLEVKEVDSLSQMLGNPFELFVLSLWSKVPFACLVAVTVWLIPVAAIFPPGTLSVGSLNSTSTLNEKIAVLDFANATQFIVIGGSVASHSYADAGASVYKAALGSSTMGQILSIPHSHVNMSYDTQFYGPAIQCGNASPELNTTAGRYLYDADGNDGSFSWVSFVGGDDHGLFNMTPCHNGTELYWNSTIDNFVNRTACVYDQLPLTWLNDTKDFVTMDTTSTDAARLYIYTYTGGYFASNLLECKLKNASYTVNFEFGVNKQTTTISKLEYINDVSSVPIDPYRYDIPVGDCLNGEPDVCPVLSYGAIMQAFNSLFVGAIWGKSGNYRILTLVQFTTLAQNFTWNAPNNDHIATDLESLFQNITISLLSFDDLHAYDPPAEGVRTNAVPVTIREVHATYQYRPLHLYLAYGLSILASAVCAFIGWIASQQNGGSYTSKFSTYARFAVSAGLPGLISSDDRGVNPCPQDLRETTIRLEREQSLTDRTLVS